MSWYTTQEKTLSEDTHSTIEAFWQQNAVCGVFTGVDDTPIHYAYVVPEQAKLAILLSNGRVETFLKYKETIYDLYQNGIACFTLDHRGQGLSGRMSSDSQHGYVKDFGHYVTDLMHYYQEFVKPVWPDAINLLCHSMGGAIGALALIEHPQMFQRAVLCSPMFAIRPSLPDWFAKILIGAGLKANKLRARESGYFFGQKPYIAYPFQVNPLTHSKARYTRMIDLYKTKPELQIGGVTSEWLSAAQAAMTRIGENADRIQTPTLIMSSARDLIIDNKRQKQVAMRIPNASYVTIEQAFHELLMEKDQYRNQAFNHLLDFLTE